MVARDHVKEHQKQDEAKAIEEEVAAAPFPLDGPTGMPDLALGGIGRRCRVPAVSRRAVGEETVVALMAAVGEEAEPASEVLARAVAV